LRPGKQFVPAGFEAAERRHRASPGHRQRVLRQNAKPNEAEANMLLICEAGNSDNEPDSVWRAMEILFFPVPERRVM
jgi:hypothetical protein